MDRKPEVVPFDRGDLEHYLTALVSGDVRVTAVRELRNDEEERTLKEFGYGVPLLVECRCDGDRRRFVFHTLSRNAFGHEHVSDRAANLLLDHATFNTLPGHVRSLDVGAVTRDGSLISLGDADEFFHLTQYVEGEPYAADLHRLSTTEELTSGDEKRALALADYLAEIHDRKGTDPLLYQRRVRDLIGDGEGIMGILDSYPEGLSGAPPARLEAIEKECVAWRWRIKDSSHRLSQVHGDFHPWNVLFGQGTDFALLDRSRGAWGEPADDVSAMTINYIMFSLRQYRGLGGPFRQLYALFWDRYVGQTEDDELLRVIQPFYAWRALVLASPVWYPSLDNRVRATLLRFVETMLDSEQFEPEQIDDYLR